MANVITLSPINEEYEEWDLVVPDYNKGFVEEIKTIPPEHRFWVAENKCWRVSDKWKDHALSIAIKYWPRAEVEVHDV